MTRVKSEPEHLDGAQRGGGNAAGGRRKQSKPIRVFMDIDADAPAAVTAAADEGTDSLIENSVARSDPELDMDVDTALPMVDTPPAFAPRDESQNNEGASGSTAPTDSFPTKYHQLGSVFQESSLAQQVAPPPLPNSPITNNEPVDAVVKPHANKPPPGLAAAASDLGLANNGKTRIFHQDAYCELCDREFCNKYFLKTHKANIHAIYDDDVGGSDDKRNGEQRTPVVSSGLPLPLLPTAGMSLPLPLPPLPPLNNGGSFSHVSQAKTKSPTNTTASSSHADAAPPAAKAPQYQHKTAMSHNTPRPISSASAPKSLPATPPKNSSSTPSKPSAKPGHDMEDYCDICQKHFCNKYYLKKHKQDVHGIAPEPSPASAGKRGRPPMSSQLNTPPVSMPSSLSASLNSLMMPPAMSSASVPGSQGGLPPGLGNVMLINPFAPPMLLQGLQQQLPPGFPGPQGGGINVPQLQSPMVTSAANLHHSESPKTTMSGLAPGGSSSNEAMQGLGVLNAEAYCEICRKEFCNKYFLRVHKATKHGIFLDEDMMPTSGPQSGLPVLPGGPDLPPGTINITPKDPDAGSNVKVKDDYHHSRSRGDDVSKHMMKDGGAAAGGGHTDHAEECHVCQKQFISKYNLKVHMANAHGMSLPDDVSPPRDSVSTSTSNSSSSGGGKGRSGDKQGQGSTMFGNMIAAKLADRVMCDICNKEVCNKYFLKTHKIKVHGVDPAKVEAETYCSPQKKNQAKLNQSMKQQQQQQGEMKPVPAAVAALNFEPPPLMLKPNEFKSSDSNGSAAGGGDQAAPRPKDEELLKMGIDPEAYCELCKKEFCSKYFLKTHKQNIHGIKMDGLPPLPVPGPGMKFDGLPPDALNGLSMMARPDFSAMAMAALSRGEPLFPLNLINNNNKIGGGGASTSGNTSPSSQADSDASGPWRWRESPNAAGQRVACELCNKELCNKYFLRTHLLNKHGLQWDMVGPQTSSTPALPFGLPPGAFPPHLLDRGGPMDLPLGFLPPGLLPRMSEDAQPLDLKKSSSPTNDNNRSRNENQNKDGASKLADALQSMREDSSAIGFRKCDICGVFFGDKVALQLHMIQDHPGDVIVSAKSKFDERKYGANIGMSLRRKYQKNRRARCQFRRSIGGDGAVVGNGIKSVFSHVKGSQVKKKYRCAHCHDRFTSRAQCQSHIRTNHRAAAKTKQGHDNGVTSQSESAEQQVSPGNKENALPASSTSSAAAAAGESMDTSLGVSQAAPLVNGVDSDRELVMQSFFLEGQGSFAPAKLVLPVYQKVHEPISITFTLKPSQ